MMEELAQEIKVDYSLRPYLNPNRKDFRRVKEHTIRTWQVSHMWDKYREIARLVSLGMGNVDIAKAVGMHKGSIERIVNSPVVQKHIGVLRGAMDADTIDLGIRIKELAPKALDIIEEVLSKGKVMSEKVSSSSIIKVAERHLDRAGYSPVKKFAGVTGFLSPSDIEDIKERAKMSNIINVSTSVGAQ